MLQTENAQIQLPSVSSDARYGSNHFITPWVEVDTNLFAKLILETRASDRVFDGNKFRNFNTADTSVDRILETLRDSLAKVFYSCLFSFEPQYFLQRN